MKSTRGSEGFTPVEPLGICRRKTLIFYTCLEGWGYWSDKTHKIVLSSYTIPAHHRECEDLSGKLTPAVGPPPVEGTHYSCQVWLLVLLQCL